MTPLRWKFPLGIGLMVFAMNWIAPTVRASDPAGVWRGEWTSESTGHRGPMRVVIRERSDGWYQARFSGRFLGVIPFVYRATLVPTRDAAGNATLDANKRLGLGLGSYTMQTRIDGNRLRGSFSAAGDRGSVAMRRVR